MNKHAITLATCFLIASCTASVSAAPLNMVGSIDSHYRIKMSIDRNGNKITGTYRYLPKGGDLKLTGASDPAGNVTLAETDEHGKQTGEFKGRIVDDKRIVGTWIKQSDKSKLPFLVAQENNPQALDGGKDGVIIYDDEKALPKPKSPDDFRQVTSISIPKVMKETLPDQKVAAQIEASLSPNNIFQSKTYVKDALDGTDTWTESSDYAIHYNKNYLVDIEMNTSGMAAYPDHSTTQIVVSTKTGKQLKAADVFSSLPQLQRLVDAQMQKAVKQAVADHSSDKDELKDLKELVADKKFTAQDLNSFGIDERGVTWQYPWAFPHVAMALQPDSDFFLPWSKLATFVRKDGPLAVFVAAK